METLKFVLLVILALALLSFLAVWCWGMWVAFTKGDDVVARFGRRILKRLGVKKE